METPRDPGTRTVLSADDLQLSFWAELAERRISVTNAEILHCVQNDMLAVEIPYFPTSLTAWHMMLACVARICC